jgi:pimeloyl-ACP methyl ester carboxylesterase
MTVLGSDESNAIRHHTIQLSEVDMHVAEAGDGPAVIFLHGFPELWYSWRHQMAALAAAGYRAIAPDRRGYGDTSIPETPADYDINHLTGDIVDLIDRLGIESATLVGHDFGALVAWSTALIQPRRVRAVAGFSVPHVPRTPVPPMQFFRQVMGDDFYMLWLQEPGVADSLFAEDIERALAGEWVTDRLNWQHRPVPERFSWRSANDQRVYIDALRRNRFTGPLNWYRNFDRNWELLAAHDGHTIDCPAMFVARQDDPVLRFMPPAVMEGHVTDLRVNELLPGVNHWVQEEAPDQVNTLLIDFLRGIPMSEHSTRQEAKACD